MTLPGQGAPWRRALPRKSRNTIAAVREKNAESQCPSHHASEHGGRKTRRTAPPKASPPQVLAPKWSLQCPSRPAVSPLRCREPPADRSGKPLGVPPPSVPTRWPLAAPRLPVQSSGPHRGPPQGSPLFGALGRDRGRWSTDRQDPGFPSWDKLKVSTHELWDLRKATPILRPAVTAPDSRLTWSNWSVITVRPLGERSRNI